MQALAIHTAKPPTSVRTFLGGRMVRCTGEQKETPSFEKTFWFILVLLTAINSFSQSLVLAAILVALSVCVSG
jgi:hypothetical protein